MSGFDWGKEAGVIVPSASAIAVYKNASGGITIRQERDWNEDEDTIIWFPSSYAKTLAQAILSAAEEE